jgi:hypothetical protein
MISLLPSICTSCLPTTLARPSNSLAPDLHKSNSGKKAKTFYINALFI